MSVGWSVSLVSAAATQTVVKTLADATANATDDASNQEESDDGDNDPDPEDGTTFSGQTSSVEASKWSVNISLLVTIGNRLETSTVLDTDATPPLLEEALHFSLSIVGSLVDIIIYIQKVPVC